ncbi:32027_t:CDS:1, partial [Gigaspora margarita]
DKVTVGNVNQFEKTVEGYPQNTVGIIVTSQKECSIKSSKCAKSSKSSSSIVFTSINEMETDIQAYFLLRKDHLNHCKIHDFIIIKFEKLNRIME